MSFAHTTKKRLIRHQNMTCLACVDEYDYEIEELCDLILKNSRHLLKIEYQISLKPDCFNIHNDGSACDGTAPDTVYGSDGGGSAPDTGYGSDCSTSIKLLRIKSILLTVLTEMLEFC